VGVWVKGPDSPLHPLVAAACLKFYYSSTLLDRALQQEDSFLLLLCPEGQPVSRCYEVRTTEPRSLPLAAFTTAVELEPAQQLARHPSGLIPLGWAADARGQPAPLALPPPSLSSSTASAAQHLTDSPQALMLTASRGSPHNTARASPERHALPWGTASSGSPGAAVHPPLLRSRDLPLPPGAPRYAARPGSSGSVGAAAYNYTTPSADADACVGVGDESEPRPSPRGLRPYGSPGMAGAGVAGAAGGGEVPLHWSRDSMTAAANGIGGAQHQYWAANEEESEDGGGRVQMGSPVRTATAPTATAPVPHHHHQQQQQHAGAPGSPSLPTLLGGPYAPSPPHHTVYTTTATTAGASGAVSPTSRLHHDTLRDSLDTGRRAVTAAAAAIANAEAAVLRGSGGGGGGSGGSASKSAAVAAGDPLRWSLQQSAQAVGGLAAALSAAASALHGPEVGGTLGSPGREWGRAAAYAVRSPAVGGLQLHPSPSPGAAAAASPPTQPSMVAVASWGGDVAARELQEEVLRLRTEVSVAWGRSVLRGFGSMPRLCLGSLTTCRLHHLPPVFQLTSWRACSSSCRMPQPCHHPTTRRQRPLSSPLHPPPL